MITGDKVNRGEVFGLPQPIQQVVNPRERVTVLDGLFVQRPIVDTHAPPTVLLQDEENRCAVRTLRRADMSLGQQILDLGLELLVLF